jgi:pimeloyl-ACP methyl ester carboxylesterase
MLYKTIKMNASRNNWKLLAAGLFLAFGRYPVSWLLSSNQKRSRPKQLPSLKQVYITCKSGNTWYVETDGVEGAQPIVFLHGLNASGLQWYHQRNYFKKSNFLIFLDLPGHGKTKRPATLDIEVMAVDLGEILQSLNVENPIIYGHSLGGMITLKYAALVNQPNAKGIIVQHSSFTNPFKTSRFSKTMLALQEPVIRPYLEFAKRHRLAFTILSMVNYLNGLNTVFYRYLLFTGAQSAAELRLLSKIAAINPAEVTAEGVLRTLDYNVAAVLGNIEVPALILSAEFDHITRPVAGRVISSKIKNAKHIEVASGHLSLVEHAVELNVLVKDFLESSLFEQTTDHQG